MWLIVLLVPHAAPPPVPAHRGRPLSEWVSDLSSPDDAEALQAIAALTAMGKAARPAVPVLAHIAFDDLRHRRALRPHARAALLATGVPPVAELMERISKAAGQDRLLALRLMSFHGPEAQPAIGVLIEAMRRPVGRTTTGLEDRCIYAGSVALCSIGPPAVEPVLDAAVQARGERPRDVSALLWALGGMGDAPIPALVRLLRSDHLFDRRLAMQALQRVEWQSGGIYTTPAIEPLRRVANEGSALADEASRLLNRIEPLVYLTVASVAAAGSANPLPATSFALTSRWISPSPAQGKVVPPDGAGSSLSRKPTPWWLKHLMLVGAAAVTLACIVLGQILRDRNPSPPQHRPKARPPGRERPG